MSRCYYWHMPKTEKGERINVQASDARRGRAPDPRDDGKDEHRHQAGYHPHRGGLRQVRRAEPHSGRARPDARQVHLQGMWAQAGNALGFCFEVSVLTRFLDVKAFSVLIESEPRALDSCFDAFSSREPVLIPRSKSGTGFRSKTL